MFENHCECCGSSRVGTYLPLPVNTSKMMPQELIAECRTALVKAEPLARKYIFPQFEGKLPFFCADCGHVSTTLLQPHANREHMQKLNLLRPSLGVVN